MSSIVSEDSQSIKMRRVLLHSRIQDDQDSENIDTTPVRRSFVRFPRLRLLDKDIQSEDVPRPVVSNPTINTIRPIPQIVKTYPSWIPKKPYAEDRFIRLKYNMEAANHLLKKKNETKLPENSLDVLKQVDNLAVKWRKKFMHQLMAKENVIPGVRQKQVLRGSHLSSENKLPGILAGRPKELWDEEYIEDGMWKSKPRKRPLIGVMDSILDMPGFQTLPRFSKRLIDWGSNDVIATAMEDVVTFYDMYMSDTMQPLANMEIVNVCAVKWNHAGNKLIICTLPSKVKLYCTQVQKMVWEVTCKHNSPCFVRCVCWSEDDQYIVTGCKGMINVYSVKNGAVVKSGIAHNRGILTLSFSSNYRYLVSSSIDLSVRVFLWPGLTPYLDITFYEPVVATAWHPHDGSILCTGGGWGDGSLSLWNVNKLYPVSYRNVEFHGGVEDLAWNKHSGELIVHWSYNGEGQVHPCTMMPVLASLDRIVDVVPVDKNLRVNTIMWNSDQTQLAVQYKDSLALWNIFGDEYQYHKHKKQRKTETVQSNTKSMNFREFRCFNIR